MVRYIIKEITKVLTSIVVDHNRILQTFHILSFLWIIVDSRLWIGSLGHSNMVDLSFWTITTPTEKRALWDFNSSKEQKLRQVSVVLAIT